MPPSPRFLGAAIQKRLPYPVVAAIAGIVFLLSTLGAYAQSSHHGPKQASSPSATSVSSEPATTASTTATTEAPGTKGIPGFEDVGFTVKAKDGSTQRKCGVLASTPEQQAKGLMGRRDLGGRDGMIFQFSGDVQLPFYMLNVPTPLSVAWFDGSGRFVNQADMEVCAQGTACPYYYAGAPYRYAVEVLKGGLAAAGIGAGSTLSVGGPCTGA